MGTETTTDVVFADNYFDQCGSVVGKALSIFNCTRLKLIANTFNDCGTGVGGASNAIDFNTGTSDFVSIEQNLFVTPTGKTQIAIQKEGTHTFANIRHNRFRDNQFIGLNNYFQFINDDNCGLATGISPAASITIPHQLGIAPKWATVQPQSNNVPGIKNITVNATNITVTFTAVPVGSISLYWAVQAPSTLGS